MSTNNKSTPSKMQTKLQTMADGLTSSTYSLLSSLVVVGSTLSKAEIIAKLRGWIALYAAVLQAKQAYGSATAARKAAEATMLAFYASLVTAVKQVAGPNNPSLLASLGITPPKPRKAASAQTRVIAQAKAKATREARGTKGKVQRLGITATPGLQVQIVPAGPTPAPMPTSPVTSGAPSSSAAPTTSPAATTPAPTTPTSSTGPQAS